MQRRLKSYPIAIGALFGFFVLFYISHTPSDSESGKNLTVNLNKFAMLKKENQSDEKNRILCWIETCPENHNRAMAVSRTWGSRCDKLIFMSSAEDKELNAIALNVSEGRENLWKKTSAAFKHIYEHYLSDFDWFLKADDDTFVIVENLRSFLYPFPPEFPIFFGYRLRANDTNETWVSGGASYVLSQSAVRKLVEEGFENSNLTECDTNSDWPEDMLTSRCLQKLGVTMGDARDEQERNRFFPFIPEDHLKVSNYRDWWYYTMSVDHVFEGLDCCSNTTISFHYIDEAKMNLLYFLIYRLRVVWDYSEQSHRRYSIDELNQLNLEQKD